jgi:hypothetical protein
MRLFAQACCVLTYYRVRSRLGESQRCANRRDEGDVDQREGDQGEYRAVLLESRR